jgi:hypothetical protein
MLKTTLITAALIAASAASAASLHDPVQEIEGGGGHAPYGYDNSTSALGMACPPGYYPHAWPQGYARCEPPGGSQVFISPR